MKYIQTAITAANAMPSALSSRNRFSSRGRADQFSTDLTTWQVLMRGNPVHLVLP